MDPQNQNIKPDYDFILNKSGPPETKPRSSKKWLIVGLVTFVILMLGIAGASLLIPKDYTTEASQTSLSYYSFIGQKNYEAAYALLATQDQTAKSDFINRLGPLLQKTLDTNKCSIQGTTKQSKQYFTTVSCPALQGGYSQVFIIETVNQADTMKIVSFAVAEEEVAQ